MAEKGLQPVTLVLLATLCLHLLLIQEQSLTGEPCCLLFEQQTGCLNIHILLAVKPEWKWESSWFGSLWLCSFLKQKGSHGVKLHDQDDPPCWSTVVLSWQCNNMWNLWKASGLVISTSHKSPMWHSALPAWEHMSCFCNETHGLCIQRSNALYGGGWFLKHIIGLQIN